MKLTPRQQKLVAKNTGLVYAVLRRLRIGGRGREEAAAEGMLALCEAAARYRADRGAAFSTWATLRVGWHLRSWLTRTNRAASLPGRVAERLGRWHGAEAAPTPEQESDAAQVERMMLEALTTEADSLVGQIVLLALEGHTTEQIARRLGVSTNTVARRRKEARGVLQPLSAIMREQGTA